MSSVERVVEQSLLYDYYGELLTRHQRRIYEAAVFENLSLGEIAEETGISRQGVHDLLKRCDLKLAQYEETLHLLERHEQLKALCESIETTALRLKAPHSAQTADSRDKRISALAASDFSQPYVKEPQDEEDTPDEEETQTEEETLDILLLQIRQLLEEI